MSTATISYREYPAPADLAAAIDCFWLLTADAGSIVNPAPVLPDGCPELIIHLGDPVIHLADGRPPAIQPTALFVGQLTSRMLLQPTGRNRVLGVRFRPGGAAVWFGPGQGELTDTSLPLEAWSPTVARELVGRAAEAATPAGAVGGVGAVLRRIARRGAPDPVVLRASHHLREKAGAVRMDDLAALVGLGPRQLTRRFLDQAGIGPKLLGRIIRFQRVFRALETTSGSWAAVAADCGYFDGSHLIRDFRSFAGDTPSRLIEAANTLTRAFTRPRMTDSSNTPPLQQATFSRCD